jgi:hypothetical protein
MVWQVTRSPHRRGRHLDVKRLGWARTYDLHPEDDERLTCDYEIAEDKVAILDSERVELRDRMKGWLRFQELETGRTSDFQRPAKDGKYTCAPCKA